MDRSVLESVKKILFVVMETLIIVIICKYLPFVRNSSYLNWAINGLMVAAVATSISSVAFREEFKGIFKMASGLVKRKDKVS